MLEQYWADQKPTETKSITNEIKISISLQIFTTCVISSIANKRLVNHIQGQPDKNNVTCDEAGMLFVVSGHPRTQGVRPS